MTTVRATTTTNGTLSTAFANGQTIDDITLVTGDCILIKDQSTATENGVYIVQSSGAPTRLQYFRTSQAISQEIAYVVEGTLYGFTQWTCTNLSGSDVVGTDNLTFTCTSIKDPINTSDTQILTNKTIDTANNTLTVAAGDVTTGTLADARVAASNVTQHEAAITHQNLSGAGTNTHTQIDTHIANAAIHETITASNKTGDEGVFNSKVGVDLQFKSLTAGTNVTMSSDANAVTINTTVGMTWQGTWVSQNYVVDDVVEYNGSAYICILNTVSNENPDNATYWDQLASKGDQGIQGTKGMVWQGAWISQNYVVDDTVSYQGAVYICKLNTVSNELPTNTTYWDVASSKGDQGDQGVQGDKGMNWQGAWVSQNYVVDDGVSYNGSSYICHTNTVSNEVPTNTSYWDLVAQQGQSEINTASNVGTGGVGLFKQKTVADLEFKKINAGSSKVTVTDDTGNDEVDIDVAEANIVIGNLSGAPTGAVVGISDTQTLTNKTIDTATNTLTVAAGDITSGTLSVARGGTGATTLTQDGILVGNGTSAVTALKSNWAASTSPTTTDDSGSGYAVGSRWIDTTADKEYVCLDSTATSAVWTETTVSGATITNTELSATTTTSTTSGTYVAMNTMTTTPASGTYMVTFSSSGSGSGTGANMEYSIFKASTIIQHSHRWLNRSGGAHTSGFDSALHSQAIVTVNGSQVIDVRYRTNNGTFTVEERSLILIKLS